MELALADAGPAARARPRGVRAGPGAGARARSMPTKASPGCTSSCKQRPTLEHVRPPLPRGVARGRLRRADRRHPRRRRDSRAARRRQAGLAHDRERPARATSSSRRARASDIAQRRAAPPSRLFELSYPAVMRGPPRRASASASLFVGPVDGRREPAVARDALGRGRRHPVRLIARRTPSTPAIWTRALNGDQVRAVRRRRRLREPRQRARARSSSRADGTPLWSALPASSSRSEPGRARRRSTASSSSAPGPRRRTTASRRRRLTPRRPLRRALGGLQESVSRRRRRDDDRRPPPPSTVYRTQGVSSVDDVESSPAASRSRCCSPAAPPGHYGVKDRRATASPRRSTSCRPRVAELDGPRRRPRRGGADRARRSTALAASSRDAEVIVADDGSRDATAGRPRPPARPCSASRRAGKGAGADRAPSAMAAAGPAAPRATPTCAATLAPLAEGRSRPARGGVHAPRGGGFGIAKRVARALIRLRTGFTAREPLSGQRCLERARARARLPARAGVRRARRG